MNLYRTLLLGRQQIQRTTLSIKVLAMAVFLVLVLGLLLDQIHQQRFSQWFEQQFTAQDPRRAEAVFARFRTSVKAFGNLAELVSRQRSLDEYASSLRAPSLAGNAPRWYSWRREWLPTADGSKGLPPVGLAMILDHRAGQVLEGFQAGQGIAVNTLNAWANSLRWNPRQTGIVLLDDIPLVFAIRPLMGVADTVQRSVIFAAPLDTQFLQYALGGRSEELLVVIGKETSSAIYSTSAPDRLAAGKWNEQNKSDLKSLASFSLDPEHPELNLYFNVYRAAADESALLAIPLWIDRQQRLLSGLLLLALFAMGVTWLSGRLRRLNLHICDLSERMGMSFISHNSGDEFHALETTLQRFTEEVIAETNALEYQALHDSLTGLPNRVLLQDRLEHAIAQALREEKKLAFLLMDLDRFKEINDTLGHHIGDRLLQEAAKRIHDVLRKSDTVARLGGDEFAVLLPATDQKHAKTVCKKIIEAVNSPFTLENLCLRVGVSIGVVMCPELGEDSNTLMQRADVAMYTAKRGGLGFSVYRPQEDEHSISRLGLVGELRDAVDRNQLELCYQPMVDFRTGKITSAEALVRWNHPTLGQIKPDEFIPLAEQSGVIRDLTMWVMHNALLQWSQWHQDGIELHLSLNMSVRVLQDKELPGKVQRLIDHHDINPSWLTLEITESAIMSDPATARRVMRRLSDMGLQLSIDDFGTGYSSLAYLKQLPVNTVKIDKSFISQMDKNENDAVIVRATIDLAHNLGLKVVAEGIETEDVWDLLEMLGCDVAQGYLIRHPVSPMELARWIASHRWKSERWASHCLAQVPA